MGNRLIIAEKPSVSRSISAVLGANTKRNGYLEGNGNIISWCAGHLLELAAPDAYGDYAKWRYADLPILPEQYKHIPSKGKAEQLEILCDLMKRPDVDIIVNACDAGREGENIFRLVYEHAKCKKPIQRLWISSMEDSAIRDGFDNLKPGTDYDNLAAAASCRECADWCVGLNMTRAFSTIYGTLLNVGRVQSPTLAMLVKREADIAVFVKEPFYTPTIDFTNFAAAGEKLKDKQTAEDIQTACNGGTATVTNIERVQKTAAPPKLFDLTSLQRDANRILGYTAQETLDYTQSLYEKKILSYPRTDAKYITADMRDTVLKMIGDTDFTPDIDRIVGAVSDHCAITPTSESQNADITTLPSGERNIFELVRKRLIAAVSPKHVYEAVTVTLDCNGHTFMSKGKTVITPGWKTESDKDEDDGDTLPEVAETQAFPNVTVIIKEGSTTPPKHFTEDTILAAMENASADEMPNLSKCGLGTPATRASVLEALIKRGFAQRVKKNLIPSDKGKTLIAILPDTLKSPLLTADWEYKLGLVQTGEITEHEFMEGIAEFTRTIVAENNTPKPEFVGLFPKKENTATSLGTCPRCSGDVTEWDKGFSCANSKTCGFKLWKDSKFWTTKKKPLTAAIVGRLFKDGKVALKDLYSEKSGKTYSATVLFDDEGSHKIGQFVNFKLEFNKQQTK